MNLKTTLRALVSLSLAGALSVNALAAPKETPAPEVQAKVALAVKAAFPDAVIKGDMATGKEDGLDVITVNFTANDVNVEGDVTPDGILVGTEEPGDIKTFPKLAAKALKKATKGMKRSFEVARTFSKTEKDASGAVKAIKLATPTVAYEADVEKNGQKGEFAFDADGKLLESPKWAKAEAKEKGDKEDKD